MGGYTIQGHHLDAALRQACIGAAHMAVERFRHGLGDNASLATRIAQIAAENALEQFRSYCNAELRLIEAEHELRAERAMLNLARTMPAMTAWPES